MTLVAEKWLLPSPGWPTGPKDFGTLSGRWPFHVELIRVSRSLHLIEMNQVCIEICKDRFKYYPDVSYYVNDGHSCAVVADSDFDLIASYDRMVHMVPDIIEGYFREFAQKLKSGGFLWLDHAGRGEKALSHRTAMTDELMREFAERSGLIVTKQYFRNNPRLHFRSPQTVEQFG